MLWTLGAVALVACGGGGGGGGSRRPTVVKEGIVFDGPLSGAHVYLDADGDGQASEGDIFIGKTDQAGEFSGTVPAEHATKSLYALLDGATDIGDPAIEGDEVSVEGIWRAPSGSTVISPLTELVVEAGDEAPLLLDELDIPDGIDVTTFNPYSAQGQQSNDRQKVLDAGRRIAELINTEGNAQAGLLERVKTALDDKPSAMSLSAANLRLDEGVTAAIKLADITFTDDGLGANSATVDDTTLFEIRKLTSLASAISDADVITDFSLSDKDGLSMLAEIRSIWLDQSSSVATGETTNDINTKDTVIYTDQSRTEIIAILEDFTGALNDSIGDTTLSLNTLA